MERFFKVTNSTLGKDYVEFRENGVKINELFENLTKEFNISANQYYASNNRVAIVPEEDDAEKLKSYLSKNDRNGDLIFFKKSSKVVKRWKEILKENNIEVLTKPYPGLYFTIFGSFSSRLFRWKDEIYFSLSGIDGYIEKLILLEGMEEMKGSEFYKVMEETK